MNAMRRDRFIDASVATERLGIKKATLYAYVSRGLVRVSAGTFDTRSRLYDASDIDALLKKKQTRRPAKAVAFALDYGMPVLETSISRIEDGKLFYRQNDAIVLARTACLEEIAALLWQTPADAPLDFQFDPRKIAQWSELARTLFPLATDRCLNLLSLLLSSDTSVSRQRPVPAEASRLVAAIACAALPAPDRYNGAMHERLAARWRRPQAAQAIRQALVLCADHELNASTFTVRVIASTGASLTATLLGGLSALSGPRHGAMTLRVSHFLDQIGAPRNAAKTVAGRLQRAEYLPGFDHPLYPLGDPRGAALLALAPSDPLIESVCRHALSVGGLRPNIDLALVALERGFGLPAGAALALFTIGRSVGWIAHALEQRALPQLIRPRARYTPPPDIAAR